MINYFNLFLNLNKTEIWKRPRGSDESNRKTHTTLRLYSNLNEEHEYLNMYNYMLVYDDYLVIPWSYSVM